MDIRTVKKLLKKYGIRPSKRMGQNFLVDKTVSKKIIRASNLSKGDTVVEIGPGIGNLTLELAEKANTVISIEKDKEMARALREILKMNNIYNVRVIEKDALKINLSLYIKKPYKVVANIPYYITSPLIRKFLEASRKPKEILLMVQKEVAERICAKPPKMNLLAVSVQAYSNPKILFSVSKKSFWPQPKVGSALIELTPKENGLQEVSRKNFFEVVKAGFSQPRKKLINNLSKKMKLDKQNVRKWLLENGVGEHERAQNLTLNNWQKLAKNYKIQH